MDSRDKTILRDLATRVAELAALPIQEERRRIWYGVNELKPIRPAVYCSPEGSWSELVPESTLQCGDPGARGIERSLRERIYAQEHFASDNVCDTDYPVGHIVYDHSTHPSYPQTHRSTDTDRGSYVWETPVRTEADLAKLQMPLLEHDAAATQRGVEFHQELFGDILQIRLSLGIPWSFGLIEEWGFLHGMEAMLWDMVDRPEFMHMALRRLMEIRLAWLDELERLDLLTLNNGNDYIASGGQGFTHELPQPDFTGHVRTMDRWGFAEAQFFTDVSPAMHEEFAVQYQAPILERFGLNSYGCCEPLHHKLPMLKRRIPRLRRVSVSPWADKRISAQELGSDYVFSWKPNPAALAAIRFDGEAVRADIRETIDIAREHSCVLEMIIKDTHTCNNEPGRFDEWTRIALEECERAAG